MWAMLGTIIAAVVLIIAVFSYYAKKDFPPTDLKTGNVILFSFEGKTKTGKINIVTDESVIVNSDNKILVVKLENIKRKLS